jgi:hypothetical protein
MNMKFASRPAFITVKKSVMKLDEDGEPMPSSNASDRPEPPQMDAPTRVRPFSVGKLRSLVEQAKEQQKEQQKEPARVSGSVTTKPVVLPPPASASLLRTPVKGSIMAAAALLVFGGVGLAIAFMPKQVAPAAAEPPVAAAAPAPAPEPVAPPPAASAAGFVFTDPVVLMPGAPGAAPEAPVAAAPAKPAEKAPEKAAEKPVERHRASADKPASPQTPVAAKPEAKPEPKAPPAAGGSEMDEMRRIQQMANSQLDKSIH